jgi:hypothetical protein
MRFAPSSPVGCRGRRAVVMAALRGLAGAGVAAASPRGPSAGRFLAAGTRAAGRRAGRLTHPPQAAGPGGNDNQRRNMS